ncbi:hypothetical protein [Roseicyclus marinus]|uniref:hypothetical protein n=1 Tax=Roseicyclus marinus TaxID=2161673 RepID=UPI0024103A0F|nr:hypothetical protein [Roseicyclus marinus]MDG3042489.1 hypothetical protein [Roseicyclus marinus]
MPTRTVPDPQQRHHVLEVLWLAPGTGRAVAETLIRGAVARDLRCMVEDLHGRRAEALLHRDIDCIEAARLEPGQRRTPWAKQD